MPSIRDGLEFEQTPAVGDGQGGLACYSPWSRKEPDTDTTQWLYWNEHVTKSTSLIFLK